LTQDAAAVFTGAMPLILGEFERLIMLTVLRLGDDAYSGAIGDDLRERAGRGVSPGAVFTTLERLEARGLVGSRYGEPTPERGGRRKRFYRLRADGRRALAHALEIERRVADGLEDQLPGWQRS
jgi:DNA-binding PadR family transcriptional regulator